MSDTPEPESRIAAFGNQLIQVHIVLREQLARLRADPSGGLPADLRAHCLAFCAAVGRHHTAEDRDAFPIVAEHHPGLVPVLAELTRDHGLVSDALTRLAELAADPDPKTFRSEVDSLAALLETHFTYEERKITAALNTLTGTATPEQARRLATATTLG